MSYLLAHHRSQTQAAAQQSIITAALISRPATSWRWASGDHRIRQNQGLFNYLLEAAPEGMRPAYVGLSNTIMGIPTLAPMVGGWLLGATSYTVLFGVTAVIVAVEFLFTLSLKPPRRVVLVEEQP